MSTVLRKEARALAPYWLGALAVVIAPYALGRQGAELSWFAYCFGCAIVGGMTFGHELQQRTMPLVLTQPITRAAVWRDKMLVLLAAMATITAALMALAALSGAPGFFDAVIESGSQRVRFLPLVALSVLCGAPLMTLATRSALGGAIMSVVVPGTCLTLAALAHLALPSLGEPAVTTTLMVAYLPLALALGFLRWRRFEVRPPQSRTLAGWLVAQTSSGRGGPLVTLVRKELRLQHGTFVLAVLLWGLFFVGGVIAHEGPGDRAAIALAVTGVDLLVLPLIVGAVALGEERTLGLADWQLALPPSARRQWLAKMLVTLPASLGLGLVVPLLLRGPLPPMQALVAIVVAHLLLTHLALWAGSVSGGTMSAVLLALGLCTVAGVAVIYGGLLERLGAPPRRTLAMAALLALLHLFAFANFRRRDLGLRRLGLQGAGAVALLAFFVAVS